MLPVLITLGAVLILLDVVALWLWVPAYYRQGVPLFVDSRTAFAPGAPLPSPETLREALKEEGWPEFLFRRLDDESLAFRESWAWKPGHRSYTPVMRGHIVFDREGARVTVRGLANLMPLVLSVPLLALPILWPDPEVLLFNLLFVVFMVGLLAWLYRIQCRRFRRVARTAAQLWSSAGFQPS